MCLLYVPGMRTIEDDNDTHTMCLFAIEGVNKKRPTAMLLSCLLKCDELHYGETANGNHALGHIYCSTFRFVKEMDSHTTFHH